jgi:hypothetical protein
VISNSSAYPNIHVLDAACVVLWLSPMRGRERGSALLVTMIIISALLAGAAVLVHVQMKSTRGAEMTRTSISSLHCAEAGLTAARTAVMTNYAQWNASLGMTTEPAWLESRRCVSRWRGRSRQCFACRMSPRP